MTQLNSFKELGARHLRTLWPSDLTRFNGAISEARLHIATVLLKRGADEVLAAASAVEGAKTLAEWMDQTQQKQLLEFVANNLKEELNARIVKRVDELIAQPLAEETRALANLGEGQGAVVAGNEWYQGLKQKFGFAANRPPFQRALEQLQTRRAGDLAATSSTIAAELNGQETINALDAKLRTYLQVPGDEKTQAALELNKVRNARLAEIKRKEYLTYFSPNERRWSPRPDGTITIPASVPADADDIRVAFVRTFERLGGERSAPYTIHWSGLVPVTQFGFYAVITVQPVSSVSCQPATGGFACSYYLQLKNDVPEWTKQRRDASSTFIVGLIQSLSIFAQGMQKDHFELTDRGWWSPSLRDRTLSAHY